MVNLIVFGDNLSNQLFSKSVYYGAFNKKFYPKIDQMKLFATQQKVRILTGNQVGFEQSILVMLPVQSKMTPSEYKTIINPKIIKISHDIIENYEESISFPYFKAKVNRYKSIYVEYDDKKGKSKEEELKGLESIWFQQGLDQLMGMPIIDWVVSKGQIEINQKYQKQAEQNPDFIKAFQEFKEEGQKEQNIPRNLYHLNLQGDRQDYPLQGPTHKSENNQKYHSLLKKLENEAFYTF